MKLINIGMKVFLTIILLWMFTMFMPMIDFEVIQFETIGDLFETVIRILTYGWVSLLEIIRLGLTDLTGMIFVAVPGFDFQTHRSFSSSFFKGFINNWFNLANDNIFSYWGGSGTEAFWTDFTSLTGDLYVLIFQVLAIFMIYYGVMSVIGNDPKYSIRTVSFLNAMIIVPLTLAGVESTLRVFNPTFNLGTLFGLDDPLPYPISDIIYTKISPDFFSFLTSSIFLIALSAFIYLELSFQVNYIHLVTSPTEKRANRLKHQLDSIKRAAVSAVVDLEKIQEETKEEKEKSIMDEEGNIIEKEKPQSVRQVLAKGAVGLTHIQEMIERRKMEDKTKKIIETLHDTRRLSNYINRLLQEDPDAEMTLTAKSSAPSAGKLIISTLLDFIYRIGGITVIVFLISQTSWVLENVLGSPPAITESVEMFTPEVILTLFIPVLLMFPLISVIIRKTKQQHLTEKLKEENIRRTESEEILLAA
ncbi:MAG: hypothetical protein GY870_15970 [archaeon]|nr:hypothetical protein [archaeon]